MVTIHLSNEDLVQTHFAFSPLWEVMTSYRVLGTPSQHALYLPWIKEARAALRGLDLSGLDMLIPPKGYVPDFLTPTPAYPCPSFADEIERIRATPPELVRKHARAVYHPQQAPEALRPYLETPAQALEALVTLLEAYWRRVLAHHWPRIQAVLEGDVLYRARQLALYGPSALFSNLHPLVCYDNDTLYIDKHFDSEVDPGGAGIVLVPVLFSWPTLYVVLEKSWRPTIGYSPRGAGLWMDVQEPPNKALALTLGAGRAAVLQTLHVPRNTGELAASLHLTAGAVSQHLGRLRKAGLVEPMRQGRRVYYHLTARGEELVRLFTA